MKQNKLLLFGVLLFTLIMLLAACGEESEETGGEAEGEDAPDFLSILTGGTSGTYYPLGGEMAQNISDDTGIQADALSSNASADNVIALQNGEAELAMVQTDVMSNAVDGVNSFEGEPVDNVLAVGSLFPETIQIVSNADSGIETVEDLEGAAVSVGAPGSGTYVNAEQILEVHGLSMDDINAQNLDFDESTSGIQDGNIDAAFITSGTPTGAVEGLGATVDINIVSMEEDKIDELIEMYPYYAEDTIEAGTYGPVEEDVTTAAVMAMMVVTDDIPEDTVYDITKSIYENAGDMAHDKAELIAPENALEGVGIDLHPGAERYLDEEGVSAD
ncbi:TAXI family TRAP transporter solute-binding subunit [Virgibacillus sp. NKC19-3]|uniref:TAXI family TRAP transporter solute-binding subunit n=1 Tax=Virgibacillus saliphilus TaxID=2831674 RepID=UPI001C9A5B92|nr:TAXI family TRAP transporter solute-binding subunit [Virgibacillus sp. NKC19-3]MBY7144879.1 TAXI family TRAP transporter solute-binding subunit [Virgibacillus sp. NKC19-3]